MSNKHIVVVGGGIAGYPAAIRAARLGASVTLVEKDELGGTCLNWGCIPTKALLHSVNIAGTIKEAHHFGVRCELIEMDFSAIMKRKNRVVERLRKGVTSLVSSGGVHLIRDFAEISEPGIVKLAGSGDVLKADGIIIATGSTPSSLPSSVTVEPTLWDSKRFLTMEKIPPEAAIIGGGVVGLELAQILCGLGSKVTVLEMQDRLAPQMDREITDLLRKALTRLGVKVFTESRVESVKTEGGKSRVSYEVGGTKRSLLCDEVISAVGRKPLSTGVDMDRLGLETSDDGAIKTDGSMRTNISGILAAGDVTGGSMLAHAAMAQGECAARNALGIDGTMTYTAIPSCIYTNPEVAAVGLSEEAARERFAVKVGRFPFSACGKASVLNQTLGLAKIVAEKDSGLILGIHIVGPHATDLISEGVLAIRLGAKVKDLAEMPHPHPTLSEALMEAAMSIEGGAVHVP
jgi:dihydrolipoamide dehydrogenase